MHSLMCWRFVQVPFFEWPDKGQKVYPTQLVQQELDSQRLPEKLPTDDEFVREFSNMMVFGTRDQR